MDGTPESIIAVIGNPIAGNPSQFAVERALRSLGLDWRVLSFDVRSDDMAVALSGLAVIGITGILVDPSVAAAASEWYATTRLATETSVDQDADDRAAPEEPPQKETQREEPPPEEPQRKEMQRKETPRKETPRQAPPIDCLYRNAVHQLVGSSEQHAWLNHQLAKQNNDSLVWLGDPSPYELKFSGQPIAGPPEPELIEQAQLVVISEHSGGPVELDADDWPADDGSTTVLDLTTGHPDQTVIQQQGYRLVSQLDRRIATLQRCLRRWTGQRPSREVIQDAMEEYLGV